LLAREVMAVPLSAEMVTISACRSAGGKSYSGEGLVRLCWAFLRAGARNVIASDWDVSDRSTAQLMSGLYREIAAGKKRLKRFGQLNWRSSTPEALTRNRFTGLRFSSTSGRRDSICEIPEYASACHRHGLLTVGHTLRRHRAVL